MKKTLWLGVLVLGILLTVTWWSRSPEADPVADPASPPPADKAEAISGFVEAAGAEVTDPDGFAPQGDAAWFELDALPLETYPELRQRWEETIDLSNRDELMREMMATLVSHDFDGAIRLYNEVASRTGPYATRDAYTAMKALSEYGSALNPERISDWIESLPPEHQNQAAHNLIMHWGQLDLEATGAWVLSRPLGESRTVAIRSFNQLLKSFIYIEDSDAAAWGARLAEEPDAAQHAYIVGLQWGRDDPAMTYDWSQRLADPSDQDAALLGLSEALAEDDPADAIEWVEKFPEGSLKQRATQRTIQIWAQADPARAASWVDRNTDAEDYSGWVQAVFPNWNQQDPAAALQWLEESEVSDELKDYFGRLGS